MNAAIERLLASGEPSVRFKVRVDVLGEPVESRGIRALMREIRTSSRVRALLSDRAPDRTIPFHPYAKWHGAHWVLATLADLGYPPGDETLVPLREQVYGWLLSEDHRRSVVVIQGRARRCASQEGNALWALLRLGLDDERSPQLASNLLKWQWPDGGWNCDRRSEAANSSFHETWIPLRALALYARRTGNAEAGEAALRAADVFLKRRLFRRQHGGAVMDHRFTRLHYPAYWHYDLLAGLTAMADAGLINDPRCREALGWLEAKRLPDGGFPAEEAFYRHPPKTWPSGRRATGGSLVSWGGVHKRRLNEFVTVQALAILRAAHRL